MDDLFLMPLLGTATVLPNARRYLTRAFNRNWCHLLCSGPLLITADHSSPTLVSGTFLSQRSETFPFVKMEKVMGKVSFVNLKKVVSIFRVIRPVAGKETFSRAFPAKEKRKKKEAVGEELGFTCIVEDRRISP